jgi:hypothetical protein
MTDKPARLNTSALIATSQEAEFVLIPGLYVQLSPSHPFVPWRGALELDGVVNALENYASLKNSTSSPSLEEVRLVIWVHSKKGLRFSVTCIVSGNQGDKVTSYNVWTGGDHQVVGVAKPGGVTVDLVFAFTAGVTGWNNLSISAHGGSSPKQPSLTRPAKRVYASRTSATRRSS